MRWMEKNHTIHVCAKLRPRKKYVKQTSWLKFRIVTHVIKSLSSWNRSESSESVRRAAFFFFKVSPIKLPSLVHRTMKRLGTVHVRKPLCRDRSDSGTRRPCSENYDHKIQRSRRTSERLQDDGVLWTELCPLQVHSHWLMGLFLNSFPQQQVEAACNWDADFQ